MEPVGIGTLVGLLILIFGMFLVAFAMYLNERDKNYKSEISALKIRIDKLEEASAKRLPHWLIDQDENLLLTPLAAALANNERNLQYNNSVIKLMENYLTRGRFDDPQKDKHELEELLRKAESVLSQVSTE